MGQGSGHAQVMGLGREAAKKALGGFLSGRTLNANQIEFIDLIIDHITNHLLMTSLGVHGVFSSQEAAELVRLLSGVSGERR